MQSCRNQKDTQDQQGDNKRHVTLGGVRKIEMVNQISIVECLGDYVMYKPATWPSTVRLKDGC